MNYYSLISSMSKTPSVDADAQLFITNAVITDTTQQNAIIQLVTDLKNANIWSKFKAIYPFVGGTAPQHRYNLKDPRALNIAFYLDFINGWTHSVNGVQPSGTDGYADTKLISNSVLDANSTHISVYSRTNTTGNFADIGAIQGVGTSYLQLLPKWSDNIFYGQLYDINFFDNTVSDSLGFFLGNRQSSTGVKLIKNGTVITSKTSAQVARISVSQFLGARNNNGAGQNYSPREQAFASIGDGLTDTEASNLYTAVQRFNTTLNRYVGVPYVSDTDAQAFITNAVITNITQANAVNTLVTSLKTNGLWTKMKAIYPFVGGTAAQHRFNLKDPRTEAGAFYLDFVNGWTHSATGAKPNGTDGYADTKLNDNTILSLNSTHISSYLRTNVDGLHCDLGLSTGVTDDISIFSKYLNVLYPRIHNTNNGIANTTSSLGLFISNRVSSTEVRAFQNNSLKLVASDSSSKANGNIFIGAMNRPTLTTTFYSPRETAFATIGDGLTDIEASNFYNIVQAYQVALGGGRAV